ncbi:unnamed protein product [Didymodactylos carnosus]|uniref:EF-hand domain-containing protein n=1 Tax=Didymodactylos carnosus TaxID=1234261 RepID=A0A814FAI4_9BILA|nr:unnamed protein product [Didymodactylos carnosus]CAF3751448.1 unnamed protein product [Didymodactylos carnosus]
MLCYQTNPDIETIRFKDIVELRVVLDSMGIVSTEEDLLDMIREVDEDQSGSVSFDEFVSMVKNAVDKNKSSREELFRAFQVFDIDQNGFITLEELRTTLIAFGDRPTEEDAADMISEADLDGDGRINYDEFVVLMQSNIGGISKKGKIVDTNAR